MEFYLDNKKIRDKSITKEKLADGIIIDSEATQTEKGLMSAADKTTLDNYGVTISLDGGDSVEELEKDTKGRPCLVLKGKGLDIALTEDENTGYEECVFSISNNGVTTSKVADKAITTAKLEDSLQNKLDSLSSYREISGTSEEVSVKVTSTDKVIIVRDDNLQKVDIYYYNDNNYNNDKLEKAGHVIYIIATDSSGMLWKNVTFYHSLWQGGTPESNIKAAALQLVYSSTGVFVAPFNCVTNTNGAFG